MKNLKMILIVGCLGIMPIAQAKIIVVDTPEARQVPSDASLQQLIQVLQFDKRLNQQLEQSRTLANQAIQQTLIDVLQDGQTTPKEIQEIQQVSSEMMQKLIDEQKRPELRQKMIETYVSTLKDYYSQEEVNAMISFYGSALGQSIVNKQPQVNQAYNEKIMPTMIENTQITLKKLMPEYEQKINHIVESNAKKTDKK